MRWLVSIIDGFLGVALCHFVAQFSLAHVESSCCQHGQSSVECSELVKLRDERHELPLFFTVTLQGTNISPKNGILKMIFLFLRWDMLIPWRVSVFLCFSPMCEGVWCSSCWWCWRSCIFANLYTVWPRRCTVLFICMYATMYNSNRSLWTYIHLHTYQHANSFVDTHTHTHVDTRMAPDLPVVSSHALGLRVKGPNLYLYIICIYRGCWELKPVGRGYIGTLELLVVFVIG